jgi:hypothetical protein
MHRYNLDVLLSYKIKEKPDKDEKPNRKSLRLVNWFLTNYSKQYSTTYKLNQNGRVETVYIYDEYDSALSANSKESFDVFCRGKDRGKVFEMEYESGKTISTSIAQLNLFRWGIRRGIFDYVESHQEAIYDDMIKRCKSRKNGKGKRKQLSDSTRKIVGYKDTGVEIRANNI